MACRSAAGSEHFGSRPSKRATSIRSVTSALTNGEAFTDQITERHSILERQDDAGTDYGFVLNLPLSAGYFWAVVKECERR
jgi:hypothetical protein